MSVETVLLVLLIALALLMGAVADWLFAKLLGAIRRRRGKAGDADSLTARENKEL